MPIYDYHCPACGSRFEALVRTGTTPICPQCQSTALEKCVSPIAPAGKIEAIRMAHRRTGPPGPLQPIRQGQAAAGQEEHLMNAIAM